MSNAYLFTAVEVTGDAESELRKEYPDAAGAYVDCMVMADSLQNAIEHLQIELAHDHYTLQSYDEDLQVTQDGEMLFAEIPDEVLDMFTQLEEDGDLAYGEFHVWEEDEE